MNERYSVQRQKHFERVVCSLCPEIEERSKVHCRVKWDEYSLRRELVACILSSQVRHEMATSALERIERAGLLGDKWWLETNEMFESKVLEVLARHTTHDQLACGYRFPNVRANQLAKTRNALLKRNVTDRISDTVGGRQMRLAFIEDIAGLGPKQASMFLRNIGKTYDIAVLDAHVLRFMQLQNLLQQSCFYVGRITVYERIEMTLKKYSEKLGFRVGLLDRAIWATMRAAWELRI